MKRRSVFKRSRYTKSQSKASIDSWTDLFANKNLMAILLPYMHLYDIIHLAMTCKRLISFYYGTKLTKVLCPIVKRDCGATYVNSPLQYLGKVYTVHRTEEGLYAANRCCICSSSVDHGCYRNPMPVKYICCRPCDYDRLWHFRIPSYVQLITIWIKIFVEKDRARVLRLINRNISRCGKDNLRWLIAQGKTGPLHFEPYSTRISLDVSYSDIAVNVTSQELMLSAQRIIDSIEW